MIKSVDFLSKAEMQRLAPSERTAVISITGAMGIPPSFRGFHGVLRLVFEDARQLDAKWAFNETQALAISGFVEGLHSSSQELDLIVHCKAGVSRSAAVAQYVARKTGCGFTRHKLSHGANRMMLRVLAAADSELSLVDATQEIHRGRGLGG